MSHRGNFPRSGISKTGAGSGWSGTGDSLRPSTIQYVGLDIHKEAIINALSNRSLGAPAGSQWLDELCRKLRSAVIECIVVGSSLVPEKTTDRRLYISCLTSGLVRVRFGGKFPMPIQLEDPSGPGEVGREAH